MKNAPILISTGFQAVYERNFLTCPCAFPDKLSKFQKDNYFEFSQFVKYTKPSQPIIQKMDMMFGHMEKYNKLTTVAPDKSNSLPFP